MPLTMPSASPATMPAATQATTTMPATGTTNPATLPSLGQGSAMRPATASVPASLSVQEAILVGLQNSAALRVQRYTVPIRRTGEEQARAAFDPTVSGSLQGGRTQAAPIRQSLNPITNALVPGNSGITDSISGNVGVTEFLPTGTTIDASLSTTNSFYNESVSSLGANVTVTQALLRGAGLDVNLASLRQAELSTKITQYQLRGFAESLVASIETTYWDLVFAERQVLIVQTSLDVAEEQLANAKGLITVGRQPESEDAAAEAEVALRKQDLINAKSVLETTRIRFLQLITPPGEPFWDRTVEMHTQPFVPEGTMDPVDRHVEVAMKFRPEINETKLQIQSGDLDVVRTKNGLLPRLDLFLSLGKTGFSESFGTSFEKVDSPNYQAVLGIKGDGEPLNCAANASYRSALLWRRAGGISQGPGADRAGGCADAVHRGGCRTRAADRCHQGDAHRPADRVRNGSEKIPVQCSTSLLVAQCRRDLLNAQLSEVQAVTNHLKALVTLYRLEGTLLCAAASTCPWRPARPRSGVEKIVSRQKGGTAFSFSIRSPHPPRA